MIAILLPAIGLALLIFQSAQAEDARNGDVTLWYQQPAGNWGEALPTGNGSLGAMVFGGVDRERIQLNVDTFWDGYRLDSSNSASKKALPEIRRLMFEGENKESVNLANQTMMGRPHRIKPYQALGDLFLESSGHGPASDYRRDLDLDAALATVTYRHKDISFRREVFASAPADCVVVRLTADCQASIDVKLSMTREKDAQCLASPSDSNAILHHGRARTEVREAY